MGVAGIHTLNFDLSCFEAAFLETEQTIVVCYYDRNNWHARLDGEMKRAFLERQHHWRLCIRTCSFRENPHTLLITLDTVDMHGSGYLVLFHLFDGVVEGF